MIIDREPDAGVLRGDWFIIACLDGYEPRLARVVTETISEQSEETITLLWNFACDSAREKMTHN